ATITLDFDRNLVRGTADALGLDLDRWAGIAQRHLENLHRSLLEAIGGQLQRLVHNLLSGTLLAALGDFVDKLRHHDAVIARIGQRNAFLNRSSTGHVFSPL